jgi:outer membrane protein assembly factor BamB
MARNIVILVVLLLLCGSCIVIFQSVSAAVASNDHVAFDVGLLWNYTTSNGVWSTPTVVDGVVYVGSEDIVYTGIPYGQGLQYYYAGNLYALDAASGAKLWNYSIPVGGSSPAVADGIVYVGSFDSNVYALKQRS